jgi:outer membrane protein TolC
MMRLRATAAAAAFGLAACAVGPRYRPPEMAVPARWQEEAPGATAGAPSLARWWTAFGDPVLDSLVARALDGSLDLKIATARIREARAARGIATSAALPQVDAHGAYSRAQRSDAVPPFESHPGAESPFGPRRQDLFEAGFDARWEIDVFGGVRRDEEAALAQVQPSRKPAATSS